MRKLLFVTALLLLALPMAANAQKEDAPGGLNPNGTPIWGSVTIPTPFILEPYIASIGIGGEVDVTSAGVGDDCLGYTDALPSFVFNLNATTPSLSFGLVSEQDATIIVSTPDGQYLCDDDSGGSLNPLVTIQNAAAGAYAIWGGRYIQDFGMAYLLVSESSGSLTDMITAGFGGMVGTGGSTVITPPASGVMLDPTLPPNFGSIDLAAGFSPDPFSIPLISGNAEGSTVDMFSLSLTSDFACRGYGTVSPDFVVNYTGSGTLRIFYEADDSLDTTLIVQKPDGTFVCNDDYDFPNPLVDIPNAQAGAYVIWVGSYTRDENSVGTLYVTGNTNIDHDDV